MHILTREVVVCNSVPPGCNLTTRNSRGCSYFATAQWCWTVLHSFIKPLLQLQKSRRHYLSKHVVQYITDITYTQFLIRKLDKFDPIMSECNIWSFLSRVTYTWQSLGGFLLCISIGQIGVLLAYITIVHGDLCYHLLDTITRLWNNKLSFLM